MSYRGTAVKTSFTISVGARYAWCMMIIAAAAVFAAVPSNEPTRTSAIVQARATVRIISGARLKLSHGNGDGETPQRRSAIILTNAGRQAAELIEFE